MCVIYIEYICGLKENYSVCAIPSHEDSICLTTCIYKKVSVDALPYKVLST